MEDKDKRILEELRRLAAEIRYGEFTVTFKVHEGRLSAGEEDISKRRRKLG